MFSSTDLLELHRRAHQGTAAVIAHCAVFTDEELNRTHPEYNGSSLALMIHHILEAEDYWMLVLRGEFREEADAFMNDEACRDVAAMQSYLARLARQALEHLSGLDNELLNRPREFLTWPSNRRILHPAMIMLRIVTHHFHHRGQVMSMCRILGKPCPGANFPLLYEETDPPDVEAATMDGRDYLELLQRTRRGTADLLEHCRTLSKRQLYTELPGFGFASLYALLYHSIEDDDWWLNMLRTQSGVQFAPHISEDDCCSIADLQGYLAWLEQQSVDTLPKLDARWLASPIECSEGPGEIYMMLPRMIVMRILTHHFHHRGQAASICRQLGHPSAGSLDFPLSPS
jgi:uncharacterized damage-inducible protein DinB